MSVRLRIQHDENFAGEAPVTYRADISDSEYSGSVLDRVTVDNFFDFEYDQIDERQPMDRPVQSASFEIQLRIESDAERNIITDIIDADEGRFQIDFYINDTLQWSGAVLTDLMQYPEKGVPFGVTISAKDLSVLEAKEFDATVQRDRISELLADCFKQTGLTLPIRSFTDLTHSNAAIDSDNDFLYEIFHERQAFQNENEPMYCMEVLENICRAYNLIIRQANGRWIVEQLPAVAKGNDTQFDYDSDGLNPTSQSPSRAITIDQDSKFLFNTSQNKIIGALKQISSTYNHRTGGEKKTLEDMRYTELSGTPQVQSVDLEGVTAGGSVSLSLTVNMSVEDITQGTSGEANLRFIGIRESDINISLAGTGAGATFFDGTRNILVGLTPVTVAGNTVLEGTVDIEAEIPSYVAFPISSFSVVVAGGDANEGATDKTVISITASDITVGTVRDELDYSRSESYKIRRDGNYSLSEEIPPTILGDGPSTTSRGIPYPVAVGGDPLPSGGWRIRGEAKTFTLQELTLSERMSMRRKPLESMRADLWMMYSPANLLNYDSSSWFFLGGYFQAKRSRWNGTIIQFDYLADEGDEFSTFTDTTSSGGAGGLLTPYIFDSIGETTEDVFDTQRTEVGIEIDNPVRVGIEYWIVNKDELNPNDRFSGIYSIDPQATDSNGDPVSDDTEGAILQYGPGLLDGTDNDKLPIQEQLLNAPKGSLIVKAPGQSAVDDIFPDFSFVSDTLEVASDTLKASMDLIEQGVNWAKVASSAVDLATGDILLSGTTGDLDDIADGTNYSRVDSIAVTASGIVLMSQISGDLDDVDDGSSFQRVNITQLTAAGLVILSVATGDIDDIDDGTNFAKVKATSVTAGEILLTEAVGDLDDLSDGSNFQRVASTQLTAGGIVLLSVASGDLDDVDDGTNFGKVNIINIDAGTGRITLVEALGDLDDIDDGGTFQKVNSASLNASGLTIVSGLEGTIDDMEDGTNFQRVASAQLTASGLVLLAQADGDLDDIDDTGTTYARVLSTEVSAGHIVIEGPDGQTVIDQGSIDTDEFYASDGLITGALTIQTNGAIRFANASDTEFSRLDFGSALMTGSTAVLGAEFSGNLITKDFYITDSLNMPTSSGALAADAAVVLRTNGGNNMQFYSDGDFVTGFNGDDCVFTASQNSGSAGTYIETGYITVTVNGSTRYIKLHNV